MKSTSDILARIVAERETDVKTAKAQVPEESLRRRLGLRRPHSLRARLTADRAWPQIIAEVKKASPSGGLLCPDYQPSAIARAYAAAGATAISVLTEPRHFLGSGADLEAVRAAVAIPVLRKDFIVDPYQLLEAAAWGADVVLLIAAALAPRQLATLYRESLALGLEALVEAHTAEEVEWALALDEAITGVNSRNLKTLQTDLNVARELIRHVPSTRLAVAESGIRTGAEIRELQHLGYRGFLVGASLLKSGDPGAALRTLIEEEERL